MKKLLFIVSALTGFAVMAEAQEATTVKTTTVQYQVPTCTNCRTTTQVKTVYPEQQPAPVCTTCAQTVVAQPVVEEHRELKVPCHDNHELGIRNPLFTPKQGQVMAVGFGGIYKAPRQTKDYSDYEQRGWMNRGKLVYGLMDRWTVALWGGKEYVVPKKSQWIANRKAYWKKMYPPPYYTEDEYDVLARSEGTPHNSKYDVNLSTEVHVLDLCHLDAFLGVQGQWHRHKTKQGSKVKRVNGLAWGPTAKIGVNFGWFTPYVLASYTWDHTKDFVDENRTSKSWTRSHGYTFNPGIYIQPSKWFGMSFDVVKVENSVFKPEWRTGFDFYPYKNVALNLLFTSHRPLHNPPQQYGVQAGAAIVF